MKLLILGGSGQLSGRLAQMALAQGHEVWALTRGRRPLPTGVHGRIADRSDPAQLHRALASAHTHWDAAVDCICMNAHDARTDLSVLPSFTSRLAVVSTDSVYHPLHKQVPQTEDDAAYMNDGGYGAHKRRMEEVFLNDTEHALHWTIFRPGHIYGPGFLLGCFPEHTRQRDLLAHIRAGKPLRLVDGGAFLIHPIYVDDMAQALLDCLANPRAYGQILGIGGPEAVSNASYYEWIGRIVGMPVQIESIPLKGYLQAHPEYSGHLCHRCYCLDKLRHAGVSLPATALEEGLRRQIAWLDAQPKGDDCT